MLTQLTNEMYAVGVPSYSEDIHIEGRNVVYETEKVRIEERLPEGKYEILGTCTENDIDFDPAEYLEKLVYRKETSYKNYTSIGKYQHWYNSQDASFRSLLASKGITEFEKLVILKKV